MRRREAMLAEKRQLESQLLRTSGEVAVAERELSGSHSPDSSDGGGGSYSDCMPGHDGAPGAHLGGRESGSGGSSGDSSCDDDARLVPRDISRLAERSAREVGALRAENLALMKVRAALVA